MFGTYSSNLRNNKSLSSFGEILFTAEKLSKSFKRNKYVFQDVAFHLKNGNILGVKGKNGAGKSTLVKILCGSLSSNSGYMFFEYENKKLKDEEILKHLGFSAPYLNLYEEFSLVELAAIYADLKGLKAYDFQLKKLIDLSGLEQHQNKAIKDFSSGMKQRVKIILSFLGNPPLIILDEPSSNLDEKGFEFVRECIADHISSGGALILASNDKRELELCDQMINLDK